MLGDCQKGISGNSGFRFGVPKTGVTIICCGSYLGPAIHGHSIPTAFGPIISKHTATGKNWRAGSLGIIPVQDMPQECLDFMSVKLLHLNPMPGPDDYTPYTLNPMPGPYEYTV